MKRLAYVDVLRGIAILSVIVHHLPESMSPAFGRLAQWGGRGVDLFFVLSGFLIGSTALARSESGAKRWQQAKAYWLLRIVRIWPLYFLLLAFFAVGFQFMDPLVALMTRSYTLPLLTFTSNDLAQPTLEIGVLWSLAVEEQFYLCVGLLIMLCAFDRKTLSSAFIAVAVVAILVSFRERISLRDLNLSSKLDDSWYSFLRNFSSLARIDQLGMGLGTAVIAPLFNTTRIAGSPRFSVFVTWAAIVVGLAIMFGLGQFKVIEQTILGLVFCSVLLIVQRPGAVAKDATPWDSRIVRPIAFIGQLSFGLYLFHPIWRHLLRSIFAEYGWPETTRIAPAFVALWLSSVIVFSWVVYRWFEQPLLRWARRRADLILNRPHVEGGQQRLATVLIASTEGNTNG